MASLLSNFSSLIQLQKGKWIQILLASYKQQKKYLIKIIVILLYYKFEVRLIL